MPHYSLAQWPSYAKPQIGTSGRQLRLAFDGFDTNVLTAKIMYGRRTMYGRRVSRINTKLMDGTHAISELICFVIYCAIVTILL